MKKNGQHGQLFLSTFVLFSRYAREFPDRLKLDKVIPLFKKGDKVLFENCRPISL